MSPRAAAEKPAPPTASAQGMTLILIAYVGAAALNLHHAAFWCLPLALGAALWRGRGLARPFRMPSKLFRLGIVLALTLLVLAGFRTLNGVAAGASLLVAMGALKLFETARLRDWLIMLGVTLFLLLAACLDAQQLWRLPLYAAQLWLACCALYALGGGLSPAPFRDNAASAGRSLAIALPLSLLLFLFVPRLPGALWSVPNSEQAETGLGDEMSPGSISNLAETDTPALHVRFDSQLPPAAERYWRGPVLHDFDGYTWRRGPGRRPEDLGRAPALQFSGTSYGYEITLEPNEHNVLIALDMPRAIPQDVPFTFSTFDYQLISPQSGARATRYHLDSIPNYRSYDSLTPAQRALDLRIPRDRNVRTQQLATTLRAQSSDDLDYSRRVLEYFRRGGFTYTLTPPLLNLDSIDDLLFNTRRGFCGHYASAFVMLMRAAGVPARVVTGYLGGQWNRYGNYLLVRQSDAHAWAEVWIDGRGWVRMDPTAVVAPERITRGANAQLGISAGDTGTQETRESWFTNTVLAWQALNAWWQDRFLGYNFNRQLNILDRFGLSRGDWTVLAVLLGIGGTAWLLLIAWSMRPRRQSHGPQALTRDWLRLERKLRAVAEPRAAHEGPLEYAERIAASSPQLAPGVRALARHFARLRYGTGGSALERDQFARGVRSFRTRASSSPPPTKKVSSTRIDRR